MSSSRLRIRKGVDDFGGRGWRVRPVVRHAKNVSSPPDAETVALRRGGTAEPVPAQSADEQQSFAEWLASYEHACQDRATCQFLEHVGPKETHQRLAPIIEFHDRATKSHEALELA